MVCSIQGKVLIFFSRSAGPDSYLLGESVSPTKDRRRLEHVDGKTGENCFAMMHIRVRMQKEDYSQDPGRVLFCNYDEESHVDGCVILGNLESRPSFLAVVNQKLFQLLHANNPNKVSSNI